MRKDGKPCSGCVNWDFPEMAKLFGERGHKRPFRTTGPKDAVIVHPETGTKLMPTTSQPLPGQ